MNEQAFGALEYEGLRALVRRGAQTPMGRALAEAIAPLSDLAGVRRALAAVTECVELRRRGAAWVFYELADPSDALARLRIEGTLLEPQTLLEVARLCEQAVGARAAIHAERADSPVLWEVVAEIPPTLSVVASRIKSKILPSGELDDRASPELAHIRAEITRLRSSITRALENLMRRSEESIQDQLVTVRNDRFVIPVRSDHRGRVHGVAHGFSSSGATIFVEPLETIDSNNELQALRETEEREVTRILLTLAEELRSELHAVELAATVVAELDFIGAKAALARELNCVEPVIDEARTLELDAARHPLLEENLRATTGGAVVPVSFSLDAERPVMIISGANAGGKTVVLKTAGLLALMALSGLHVPARAARVPLYATVLADIGDRQSLAANLSTFTAHVANIRQMLELCASPALVLLDEVGTGTDPEEGSALGVAVVDHFRRACGAHVVATTHYSGLKMYAANDESVVNASVEFDEKTLQPTYRLIVGVAGASSGLDIARRFGFPETIIGAARERVDEQTLAAADYLRRIKRESEEAEALRRALEEERAAVAEKYAALDREAERRERERQTAFARQLQTAVADFEQRSQELFSKIEDRSERIRVEREAAARAAELRREAQRATEDARRTKTTRTAATNDDLTRGVRVVRHGRERDADVPTPFPSSDAQATAPPPARAIRAGDRVRLRTLGTTGLIERLSDGEAEVLIGSLRFREKLENLELMAPAARAAEKPAKGRAPNLERMAQQSGTEFRLQPQSKNEPHTELNLIGRTTDEAVDETDKFLDEAYMHSLGQIRIVHGHGTGALRRAIAQLLKSHPHVASFAPAPPEHGGAGATVVELKQ
ncbi:MAG TPA: Smr/MutS family protein [Pyrinomonadaceae bacterium]|jgi:DNA mismatch repair protein MutS2